MGIANGDPYQAMGIPSLTGKMILLNVAPVCWQKLLFLNDGWYLCMCILVLSFPAFYCQHHDYRCHQNLDSSLCVPLYHWLWTGYTCCCSFISGVGFTFNMASFGTSICSIVHRHVAWDRHNGLLKEIILKLPNGQWSPRLTSLLPTALVNLQFQTLEPMTSHQHVTRALLLPL